MRKKEKGICPSDVARFHEGYVIDVTSRCWIWQKNIQRRGYGHFKHDGKQRGAHRFAFECFNGPIPPGMHVLHRCDRRACVNPEHLFIGTCMQNVQDKIAKGRHARGEMVGTAKLSADQIFSIYKLSDEGIGAPTIAKMFGISTTMAWNIKTGRSWVHLFKSR